LPWQARPYATNRRPPSARVPSTAPCWPLPP
jgi:hypothetical protein